MVAALVPGALIAGRYRLEQQVARGGMGSVWRAQHVELDAPVAVKFMTTNLEPSLLARFEREAKACARLVSPHIVKVSDFGTFEGSPYMVMELLEGEDLGARLKREGRLPLAILARVAEQIGKGLSVAHAAGIVHRDLKPANVFMARAGNEEIVKLLDFGVARETESRMVDDHTTSGVILGSPHHMSPEQAAGELVDTRSDLWSFGVLLYQGLTGKRPFDGATLTATLLAITTKRAEPPTAIVTGLPPEADAFFVRALSRQTAQRFQSADEMVAAFLRFAGESRSASLSSAERPAKESASELSPSLEAPTVATGSQVISGVERGVSVRTTKSRGAFVAVPLVVVAGVLGGWFVFRQTSPAAPQPEPVAAPLQASTAAPAVVPTSSSSGTAASPTVEPIVSGAASASAASIASEKPKSGVTVRPEPRKPPPLPTQAATAAPTKGACPAGKAPDPFTGLCVTKR